MNRKRAASALTYIGVQAFTINYRYLSGNIINHQRPTGTFPYHQVLHVKRNPKVKKEKKGFQNTDDSTSDFQQGVMNTALCIVPPDDAWDDIQRARHLAKDPSFFTWPPAIRLFHPFVDRSSLTQVASSVAELIEKYDLESFDITIDKLLILPHFEDLEQHEDAQKLLPKQVEITDQSKNREEELVQELIQSEEKKGRRKSEKRKAKEKILESSYNNQNDNTMNLKDENDGDDESNDYDEGDKETRRSVSPSLLLQEQRKSMSEFNGPCVLYLEPNEESKIHIQAFREILRKKLFSNYDPFSPSSTVTNEDTLRFGLPRHVLKQHGLIGTQSTKSKSKRKTTDGSSFRPVIPLGRFSTVSRAVQVAKKLQAVWEPLTFRVSDLHLVSKIEQHSFQSDLDEKKNSVESSDPYRIHVDEQGTPHLHENRELSLRKFHGTDGTNSILSTKGEYGCDAMIMLEGEEHQLLKTQTAGTSKNSIDSSQEETETSSMYLDKKDEAQIMKLLMSPAAIPGGQGETELSSYDDVDTLEGDDDDEQFLQSWLEEDEDIDDGATIIIGRIQFFMGEMRQYTGMPASSTIDGKDRALGDNNVSGSARRRGAVHRQGDRWQEGDYGRKEKDYQP